MCISIPGVLRCLPRISNNSITNFDEISISLEFIGSAVLLCFLELWIILSNAFVIISLCCQSRKRSNLNSRLLVSLAIADLGLGISIVPIAILRNLTSFYSIFLFHCSFCLFWLSSEVFLFAASMLNVATIALDRFLAICYAINYSQLTTSLRAQVIVATPWCLAGLLGTTTFSVFKLYRWQEQSNKYATCGLGIYCTLQDGNLLTSTLIGVLTFLFPLSVVTFTSIRVLTKVLHTVKERNAGVLQNSEIKQKHLKGCPKSTESESDKIKRKPSLPGLRVHIGGQPCFMSTKNTKQGDKRNKNLMSPFSPELNCGILNISIAPVHQSMLKSKNVGTNKVDSVTSTPKGPEVDLTCQIDRYDHLTLPKKIENQYDILPQELTASNCDKKVDSIRKRQLVQTTFNSLKPPKWLFAGSPRKSDPEFINLRNMRRCAIKPVARMNHSVSNEALNSERLFSQFSDTPRLSIKSPANLTHRSSGNELPDQSRCSEKYRACPKQAKVGWQFLINCGYLLLGMMPFYTILILGVWLPLNTAPFSLFTTFYWLRFATIALNPIVNGYISDEVRRSFRRLLYCGRPKQEKKALQRLVMAGLAAGGISLGRPIYPTSKSPEGNSCPRNVVIAVADVTPAVTDPNG